MMPRVRIRNVSKEYKLVAGVFSPELLKLEESLGKPDPIDGYNASQGDHPSRASTRLGDSRATKAKSVLASRNRQDRVPVMQQTKHTISQHATIEAGSQ